MTNPVFDEDSSLVDMMEDGESNVADNENEPVLLQNSPYIDNVEFKDLLRELPNSFKILSLNCQSLNAKFQMLKTYLDQYNNPSNVIDAICLQETWLAAGSDLSLLQIPG